MTHESKGPRFTGRCPCGHNLELAYDEHLKKAFFNCFRCFPMFKNLAEVRQYLEEHFKIAFPFILELNRKYRRP